MFRNFQLYCGVCTLELYLLSVLKMLADVCAVLYYTLGKGETEHKNHSGGRNMDVLIKYAPLVIAIVVVLTALTAFGRWCIRAITREDIDTAIQKVKDEIIGLLAERLPPPRVDISKSPRALSDFGKEVSQHAKVDVWVAAHAQRVPEEIADKEEFEIEEIAIKYVRDQYNNSSEFQRDINRSAYDKGITPNNVMTVFEIELRDALMVKRISDRTLNNSEQSV